MNRASNLLPLETITQRILLLRGHCARVELKAPGTRRRPPCGGKVLLDADLAALYGVETRRLNEQVRRNLERFPEDFIRGVKFAQRVLVPLARLRGITSDLAAAFCSLVKCLVVSSRGLGR